MSLWDRIIRGIESVSDYSRVLARDLLILTGILFLLELSLPLSVSFYVSPYVILVAALLIGVPALLDPLLSWLGGERIQEVPRPVLTLLVPLGSLGDVLVASAVGLIIWLSVGFESLFGLLYGFAVAVVFLLLLREYPKG